MSKKFTVSEEEVKRIIGEKTKKEILEELSGIL